MLDLLPAAPPCGRIPAVPLNGREKQPARADEEGWVILGRPGLLLVWYVLGQAAFPELHLELVDSSLWVSLGLKWVFLFQSHLKM